MRPFTQFPIAERPAEPEREREFWRVSELRRVYGIGKGQIFSLLRDNALEGRKIGRSLFISDRSVRKLFDDAPPWRPS